MFQKRIHFFLLLVSIFSEGCLSRPKLITCESKEKTTANFNLLPWCSGADCFLSQSNNFNQTLYRNAKQKEKTKCKESFVELTEKYLKIQKYSKHIWGEVIREELFFRMLRMLKINVAISEIKMYPMNVFLLNILGATTLLVLSKPYCH